MYWSHPHEQTQKSAAVRHSLLPSAIRPSSSSPQKAHSAQVFRTLTGGSQTFLASLCHQTLKLQSPKSTQPRLSEPSLEAGKEQPPIPSIWDAITRLNLGLRLSGPCLRATTVTDRPGWQPENESTFVCFFI